MVEQPEINVTTNKLVIHFPISHFLLELFINVTGQAEARLRADSLQPIVRCYYLSSFGDEGRFPNLWGLE
jgi:hypothetical protein